MNPWDTISTNNTVQNETMRRLEKRLNQEADSTPQDEEQHAPVAKMVDAIRAKLGHSRSENASVVPTRKRDIAVSQ